MGCLKLTYYQENEPLLKCVWNKNEPKKTVQWFYTVDPLAEKYTNYSPFAYCMNNPVRLIDPSGMGAKDPQEPPLKQKTEAKQQTPLDIKLPDYITGNNIPGVKAPLKSATTPTPTQTPEKSKTTPEVKKDKQNGQGGTSNDNSSYAGVPVYELPVHMGFNIPGVGIFVGNKNDKIWVGHEHGHYLIFQNKGLIPWTVNAVQSIGSALIHNDMEHLHSDPEIEANMMEWEFKGKPYNPSEKHLYPLIFDKTQVVPSLSPSNK